MTDATWGQLADRRMRLQARRDSFQSAVGTGAHHEEQES